MGTSIIPQEALVHRLRVLVPTQQSIEGTSHWALFFASDQSNVTAIVSAWGEEIAKAPNEKKLALLYLSNHILQEGKRKGRLFGEEFSKVISKAVREVLRTADPKTRSSVGRVVRVWEERRVFGSSVIKGLKEQVAKAEAANKGSGKGSNGGGGLDEATKRKLQAVGPLAQLLSDASMAAEKSQEHATKALQVPQHILEVGSIAEVESAQTVLSNCLSVLETEVQCRQRAAGELREQVSKQEDAMRHAQQQLQQFEQQKAMADARMGSLEQQRQQQQQQRLQQQQQRQQQPLPNGMAGPGGRGMMGQPAPPPQLAHLMALQGISGPMPNMGSMGLPPGVPGPLSHPMGPQGMPFASMPLLPPMPPEAMLMAMQQQQQQGLPPVPPPPQALAMLAASGGLPPPHLPAAPFSAPPAAVPGQAQPQPQPPHPVMQQPQQHAGSAPVPQAQPPHTPAIHPQPPQQPQPQPSRPGAAPPPPSQPFEQQQQQQQPQPQPPQQQQQQQQQPNLESTTDQDTAAMFAKAFAEMPEEERQRLAAGMAAAVAHTSQAPSSAPPGPPPPPPGGPTSSHAGEGGTNGVGEDSLLADADFSRFILGEDPMGGQADYGGDDDYDPENPF